MDRSRELEAFKSQINLSEYAASLGYKLDRHRSSRNSAIMRGDDNDKIVITRGHDGHYIYFSIRDETDHGSIIDFHQRRTHDNLGETRKSLRLWIGASPEKPTVQMSDYQRSIAVTTHDRAAVIQSLSKMHTAPHHPYLTSRSISPETLGHRRFARKVLVDDRNNAIFPHVDREGISGYEIKNHTFTGFSPGGQKSVWISNAYKSDTELVITESAIDALSHYQVHKNSHARYISLGGTWSEDVDDILLSAARQLPGEKIKLAFDNDPPGDQLVERARAILEKSGKTLVVDRPRQRGQDWNQHLQLMR